MENKPPTPPQSESGATHKKDRSTQPKGNVGQGDEQREAAGRSASPEVEEAEASGRQQEQPSEQPKKRLRSELSPTNDGDAEKEGESSLSPAWKKRGALDSDTSNQQIVKGPAHEDTKITQVPASEQDEQIQQTDSKKGAPAVRLDMDLDVDIELKAKIKGDVTLAVLEGDQK